MSNYVSTKIIELGSCAFRQWRADHSHCRFLHGYQLTAKLWFGSYKLDARNWVVDFGGLKELKAILNKQFDHTLCAAKDDPAIESFRKLHEDGVVDLRVMDAVGIEKAAEWVFKTADAYIRSVTSGKCWVKKVEVFEHEDNSAIYEDAATIERIVEDGTGYTSDEVFTPPPPINTEVQVDIRPLVGAPLEDRAAQVGGNVTTGTNDWFKGTIFGGV